MITRWNNISEKLSEARELPFQTQEISPKLYRMASNLNYKEKTVIFAAVSVA